MNFVVRFLYLFGILHQVMWSTFIPYVPNTILPGAVAFVLAILAVFMVSFDTVACIYGYFFKYNVEMAISIILP